MCVCVFEATRPLTIAEQIEALSKKKKKPKKPLKPGQMGLTGCARALLIITNVMFLVSMMLFSFSSNKCELGTVL